ncbi:D-aminoacyl-tRNA deacylase [Robiginitalea sp. M366]|uniref:D-aminoacyl-tRNA deacylase n=1 Tax=Robiginitalea aestuariiviva TaxID=3036903 RepID=UPI00240E823B|nr:D-aminoacyl-tRNA deacylase [Robiginitalea aestuariiviva]MDG1570894.1 D-aminoacyl-tRNA deacylase [Robiginitalea aestuariiviva]
MRAVIQRVLEASVTVEGQRVAEIGPGLLVLLGVEVGDTPEEAEWLAHKVAHMRIFNDAEGVMNRSLLDTGGQAIAVSQFTLLAATKKGHRPSYIRAARPGEAVPLYTRFVEQLSGLLGKPVGEGVFGADMKVALTNDGPVTITMDSRRRE